MVVACIRTYNTMQESIIDVKLFDRPPIRESYVEDESNSRWLVHWTEGVMIIQVKALMKALANRASLIPRY